MAKEIIGAVLINGICNGCDYITLDKMNCTKFETIPHLYITKSNCAFNYSNKFSEKIKEKRREGQQKQNKALKKGK